MNFSVDRYAQRERKNRLYQKIIHRGNKYQALRITRLGHGSVGELPKEEKFAIIIGFPDPQGSDTWNQHETHLPAFKNPPCPYPWLFGPHENPWWPCRDQCTTRQGSQAPGRLSACAGKHFRDTCSPVVHLKHWAQFQAVMRSGIAAKTPHFVLHQWPITEVNVADPGFVKEPAPLNDGVLSLGALTPKRWAKRAVTRNLIKRQIHHVSTELGQRLPATAYVVRLRAAFDTQTFVSASSEPLKQCVREELTQLFGKVLSP
jgi:ribonuclease P protein component